jgi:hypothetical protein
VKLKFSPAVFSCVFCIAYVCLFAVNEPMLKYFPMTHQWTFGASEPIVKAGPVIVWYGLVASSSAIALVGAVIVADSWFMSWSRACLWLWPCASAAACLYLLRVFFL